MARVLLILPTATYRASAFLEAAAAMGVEVMTGSERPAAMAGTMGARFVELDLDDPAAAAEAIVAADRVRPFDAVVAVDDQGLLCAALAAERLGLAHNPVNAVAATRDKVEQRRRLGAGEVRQPRWRPLLLDEPAAAEPSAARAEVLRAAGALGYPVVLKPAGLSASRGVIRADDQAELLAALERDLRLLDRLGEAPRLVLEEYVPGTEHALEGVLFQGELQTVAVFDKPDPLVGPFFEETIYVTPSRLAAADQRDLAALVQRAAGAIGLQEGPVHAEVRRTETGELVLLEVAARTIGGRCAAVLRSGGSSLEALVLAHALGERARPAALEGASGVVMLPIARSGRLVRFEGAERAAKVPHIVGVELTAPVGERLEALPEGGRYLGFVFARADAPDQVVAALRAAQRELEIEIAPEIPTPPEAQ